MAITKCTGRISAMSSRKELKDQSTKPNASFTTSPSLGGKRMLRGSEKTRQRARKSCNKPTHVRETCQERLRVTISPGEKPDYQLERQNDAEHSHDLLFSDTLKTNSA